MVLDTDVLIWYMRGNKNAYDLIENLGEFSISVVTYIELVQGMRNKNELNSLRKALSTWRTTVLYISEEISANAMFLVEQHFLSHSLQLADALTLIGATVLHHGPTLITGNDRHYRAIRGLKVKKFEP